jgi:cytoskeletal protein RodZ
MEINSNSPQSNGNPPTPEGLDQSQRPGEYLRHIRLSQNKSLADVAQELKIAEKQLQALEADDYKALPEAPFIKGYYRAYAKYLHTDASSVIVRFDEHYKSATGLAAHHTLKDSPIKTMGRLTSSGQRSMNKWVKRCFILLVLIFVGWVVWALLHSWMEKKRPTELSPAVEITPSQPLSNTSSATVPKAGDQLQLEFQQPTSVMIVDAAGKTLAEGRQDQALSLQGQAPFNIRIDDAAAVKLKLNNEQINLQSFTNASGSANLTLSP